MRRSLAPSQVAKRHHDQNEDGIIKKKPPSKYSPQVYVSPYRKPLTILSQNSILKKDNTAHANVSNCLLPEPKSHEQFIKAILSKPFKLPLPNYKGRLQVTGQGLGLKRQLLRKPLHDPFEEDALVLYSPPDISTHEAMKLDKSKVPVHVVVDPLLSKV